jgi:hypothetical protein
VGRPVKPLAIDLFCGLGGWSEGLLAEGYSVVGFDNERHHYGDARYPAQLVIQDVLTLHGSQFKDAALIVASPPCQAYSYRAMPWKKAKALPPPDNTLFEACFRIQREAEAACGRSIPLVVENVCGAQKWVGKARWHYGSFYLWGDVPALMPITWKASKRPGHDWNRFKETGEVSPHWRMDGQDSAKATKNDGGSWFAVAHNTTSGHGQNPDGRRIAEGWRSKHYEDTAKMQIAGDGIKVPGNRLSENGFAIPVARQIDKTLKPSEFELSEDDRRQHLSYSRKAASAHIAKIPFPLARWIARAWFPV